MELPTAAASSVGCEEGLDCSDSGLGVVCDWSESELGRSGFMGGGGPIGVFTDEVSGSGSGLVSGSVSEGSVVDRGVSEMVGFRGG